MTLGDTSCAAPIESSRHRRCDTKVFFAAAHTIPPRASTRWRSTRTTDESPPRHARHTQPAQRRSRVQERCESTSSISSSGRSSSSLTVRAGAVPISGFGSIIGVPTATFARPPRGCPIRSADASAIFLGSRRNRTPRPVECSRWSCASSSGRCRSKRSRDGHARGQPCACLAYHAPRCPATSSSSHTGSASVAIG